MWFESPVTSTCVSPTKSEGFTSWTWTLPCIEKGGVIGALLAADDKLVYKVSSRATTGTHSAQLRKSLSPTMMAPQDDCPERRNHLLSLWTQQLGRCFYTTSKQLLQVPPSCRSVSSDHLVHKDHRRSLQQRQLTRQIHGLFSSECLAPFFLLLHKKMARDKTVFDPRLPSTTILVRVRQRHSSCSPPPRFACT